MAGVGADGIQTVSFSIKAWAGWLPGMPALVSGGEAMAGPPLPAGLRRRATPLGRKMLEVAWPFLAGRQDAPRIVLASRHGEYDRTWGLSQALAAGEELSPAEFSLSIHHGLAALLSIATGNRGGHTALACGGDTFGFGCVEAAVCLADGDDRVLLLYYDAPLPDIYRPITDAEGDEAVVALLLEPAGSGGETIHMDFLPAAGGGDGHLLRHFASVLTRQADQAEGVGDRMMWRWRHVA
ncbi:MAG: beta-ketoacyl synthase chain length factor [Bacteroidota bacterium]